VQGWPGVAGSAQDTWGWGPGSTSDEQRKKREILRLPPAYSRRLSWRVKSYLTSSHCPPSPVTPLPLIMPPPAPNEALSPKASTTSKDCHQALNVWEPRS
jgi:hypothetical protein